MSKTYMHFYCFSENEATYKSVVFDGDCHGTSPSKTI